VISLTPGLGTLGNLSDWWTEPIVFQPAGFAFAGPLAAVIGAPATLLGSAAVQASACIAASLSVRRE
jgi:hypothetical protein